MVAVIRPILVGLLYGLKADVAAEVGGRENVKLKMLERMLRKKDGDLGICFEYAVHDAMRQRNPMVLERVDDVLTRLCGITGDPPQSILFAIEKSGSEQLVETATDLITPESRLMSGARGQPAKLHKHIERIAQAFRRPDARDALPYSISGVWKADLFIGKTDTDRWVATTVKSNPRSLEKAPGLRVGIVPASHTGTDQPYMDEKKNLAVCPLLHDGNFMQLFYEGWQLIQFFLNADAKLPSEAKLPRPPMREVARILQDRREYPVVEVIDALAVLAQPELLDTENQQATVVQKKAHPQMELLIAPEAKDV